MTYKNQNHYAYNKFMPPIKCEYNNNYFKTIAFGT
jgi:hypothetical protein